MPWVAPIIPWVTDSDNDGILDAVEVQLGTNPHNPDTDGDGIPCVHSAANMQHYVLNLCKQFFYLFGSLLKICLHSYYFSRYYLNNCSFSQFLRVSISRKLL
jgi:hypothetical protein